MGAVLRNCHRGIVDTENNRDPNSKALQRKGFINHVSTSSGFWTRGGRGVGVAGRCSSSQGPN